MRGWGDGEMGRQGDGETRRKQEGEGAGEKDTAYRVSTTILSASLREQSFATDEPWERRHLACPVEQNTSPTGIYNFLDNEKIR